MFSKYTLFFIYGLFASTVFSGCTKSDPVIQMYYWKQDFELSEEQQKLLDTLHTSDIYVKLFDIDIQGDKAAPLAKINFSNKALNQEIVPCVYITNRTMQGNINVYDLAKSTFDLVEEILAKNRINTYKEIQFDCDWTASSKSSYFQFLEEFKKLCRKEVLVTSTIRLHQLKYPKETGVPPVEKVCLMVYNVGDIKDPNEINSIFKPSIVDDYIEKSTSYPLPMDIALPVYSWAVLYRFEKLSLIFNNMNLERLEKNQWLEKEEGNVFRSTKNHYFEGNYLYEDDLIRLEDISMDSLQKVMPLFKNLQSTESKLILFELSNENCLTYTYEDYENIRHSFY